MPVSTTPRPPRQARAADITYFPDGSVESIELPAWNGRRLCVRLMPHIPRPGNRHEATLWAGIYPASGPVRRMCLSCGADELAVVCIRPRTSLHGDAPFTLHCRASFAISEDECAALKAAFGLEVRP